MADIVVKIISDAQELMAARRLHGSRYLAAGFVGELDQGGVIDDEWVSISTYFGAYDPIGEVVGVSRLIPSSYLGLPAFGDFVLRADAHDMIRSIPPAAIAEVSALAVRDGQAPSRRGYVAGELYRAMYQHSVVRAGQTHWCAALDVRVKRHLMRRHHFLFEEIGHPREYLGSMTVPVILDLLGQARHYAFTAPEENAFFLAGLEIDLRGDEVRLLPGSGEFLPDHAVSSGAERQN